MANNSNSQSKLVIEEMTKEKIIQYQIDGFEKLDNELRKQKFEESITNSKGDIISIGS